MADGSSQRVTRKHGLSYTPEYRAWQTMRLRCTNPRNPAWKDYGGRGITVCEAWLDDPTQFYRDMGKKPSPKHEIDRIDNDRGYEPNNCRWVPRIENCRNRRSSRVVEWRGESRTVAEWAASTRINSTTIIARLGMGWDVDRALSTPARSKPPKGQGLSGKCHPCADCSKPVHGVRCHACENRRRPLFGNSVSPPPLRALAHANLDRAAVARAAA